MDKQKASSMAEIARVCGVSKTTVSRVINNSPRGVSEETRNRILAAMNELRYRPNSLARGIAISRSGMVGLIVPDVSNFFYPKVIRGVMDVLDERGYSVVLGNSNYVADREAELLLSMIDKRVDGIILCSGVSNKEFLSDFRKYNVPLGLVGRTFDASLSDASIAGDNIMGGYRSANYFIQEGRRRIVYVEGRPEISGSRQRMAGYRQAHEEAGLPVCDELLLHGDYSIEYGKQVADELLASRVRFDAIMTGSDLIAIGILSQLQKNGVRVPEDVEIIGYDNIELTTVFQPQLSTISKPHYDMAQHLTRQMIDIIEGVPVPLSHTIIEPTLVLRETTMAGSADSGAKE